MSEPDFKRIAERIKADCYRDGYVGNGYNTGYQGDPSFYEDECECILREEFGPLIDAAYQDAIEAVSQMQTDAGIDEGGKESAIEAIRKRMSK